MTDTNTGFEPYDPEQDPEAPEGTLADCAGADDSPMTDDDYLVAFATLTEAGGDGP